MAEPGDPLWWITAVGAVGTAVAVPFVARDFRRTGRFLAHTSEEDKWPHSAGRILDQGTPPHMSSPSWALTTRSGSSADESLHGFAHHGSPVTSPGQFTVFKDAVLVHQEALR